MATDVTKIELPSLPAPHEHLAKYVADHPDEAIEGIIKPYRQYENQLRSIYAQDRQNPILEDPYLNVLPLFNQDTQYISTRARDLSAESEEEKSKYIMALPDDKRRPHGSPATVASISEFQKNFNIFSESSIVGMDWSNVVAAGSSVVNCLLPVPKEFDTTKRKLREYYHEKFCPASDVDLFLYGLNHEQAIEKIKQIEQAVRDALLNEVTVVRTKYALTIASQYPVRHVQIVLRVYKSISEILTGFDIDAAGGAYDGNQVYVTPRALASFITQINHIDLSRRSPSYENRLSKYSHRNFEVYWSDLDRSRVDPTIFERSFQRTLGLARLLVLERLPTNSARDAYLNKRRSERGRPTIQRSRYHLGGNLKDHHEDEVADWLSEEEVSSYHTFTIPYGEKFNAKRVEKLCYTRDLLLNAEWNQPKDREVYLHRHPAFFGRVQDVIEDCCGSCPEPKTEEEKEVAEKEAEIYISGKVSFLIDDPGRQQIGSFHPLTEQDWTDMAYVGNTARLCQSIVHGDVDDVLNWLSQPEADPNSRDYTGRTPLHLAVMASTPEIAKCLVEHGARLTARLADGRTALHLAAARGNTEMIKLLMERSIENEEAEEERKAKRRQALKSGDLSVASQDGIDTDDSDEDSVEGLTDYNQSETDAHSVTTGSFIKVEKSKENEIGDIVPEESDDEPDYYQIDVLAWDIPCSPLHLAIVGGHEAAVKTLCDFGADSILPVKFLGSDSEATAAILTLTLALSLRPEKAQSMAQLLIRLGAISSQADQRGVTAFYKYVESGKLDMVKILLDEDKTGVKAAINHLVFAGYSWSRTIMSPLHSAIENNDTVMVLKLLEAGANPQIDFETWLKSAKVSPIQSPDLKDFEANQKSFHQTEQPLITAIRHGEIKTAMKLLDEGADCNSLTPVSYEVLKDNYMRRYNKARSALDLVQEIIDNIKKQNFVTKKTKEPKKSPGIDDYLQQFESGTYRHAMVAWDITSKTAHFENSVKKYEEALEDKAADSAAEEKAMICDELINELEALRVDLQARGAKSFAQMHPHIEAPVRDSANYSDYNSGASDKNEPEKPYEYIFKFMGDKDITDHRRQGYIELFEAAWSGNLERIKQLTLQAWGSERDQPPLKIAISDTERNSPFSIAFVRGHREVAKAVLDIVKAQWSPKEEQKVRYKLRTHDDSDAEDSEYASSADGDDGEGDPDVVSEKVDRDFTIENVGQVSLHVESHTKPLDVITQLSKTWLTKGDELYEPSSNVTLFVHCLKTEDSGGLKFLLDLAQHWAKQSFDDDDAETSKAFTFPPDAFEWAIDHGKVQLLGMVIKSTGAGIPLDHLVKKSGAVLKEKPKFYQGLTVYGKKRKDWANAGRNTVVRSTGLKTPPLLHAALAGNLESVEFFLSDTPNRLYGEFGKSKLAWEDPRLKHLRDMPGGFDRAISKWLGADNEFVIHAAVIASTGEQAVEVLEFLIDACPVAVEKKDDTGNTPLMVACRLGRLEVVKLLIDANADQSTRNSTGQNIIHAMLSTNPEAHRLRRLLDELDPDLRKSLFLQRTNLSENGRTPIQAWIEAASPQSSNSYYRNNSPYAKMEQEMADVLKLLLEYADGEGLDMLDSAGDTSLHIAIMREQLLVAKVLIEQNPSLLYRENAVGRTPAEVAYETLTARDFQRPHSIGGGHWQSRNIITKALESQLVARSSDQKANKGQIADQSSIKDLGLSESYDASELARIRGTMGLVDKKNSTTRMEDNSPMFKRVIWDLCSTAMRRHPNTRRLVSLNEANDVARRLGEQETRSRYFSVNSRRGEDEDGEEEEAKDQDERGVYAQLLAHASQLPWAATDDQELASTKGWQKCDKCEKYHE